MNKFADKENLQVTNTGQTMVFYVNGVAALTVDITSVDLIDTIRAAISKGL